jgi:hypothetical protein
MAATPNLNWVIRHHRTVCPMAWVVGTIAITALFAGRVDPSAIVVILVFFAIVIAGVVAGFVAICKHRLLGMIGIVGWIALPVLHRWAELNVTDGWAPTMLADLVGLGIAAAAAVVAVFVAFERAAPLSRWWRVFNERDHRDSGLPS